MRRKNLILLIVLVLLYLGTSLTLQAMYGSSYGFLEGENRWRPDGGGGWEQQGSPIGLKPETPSEIIPPVALALPILVPGFVLILFMFTPLRHRLEDIIEPKEPQTDQDDPETGEAS